MTYSKYKYRIFFFILDDCFFLNLQIFGKFLIYFQFREQLSNLDLLLTLFHIHNKQICEFMHCHCFWKRNRRFFTDGNNNRAARPETKSHKQLAVNDYCTSIYISRMRLKQPTCQILKMLVLNFCKRQYMQMTSVL